MGRRTLDLLTGVGGILLARGQQAAVHSKSVVVL